MGTEPRRRRSFLREAGGEILGLAVEAAVVGAALLVALGVAALVLLVA